MQQRNRGVHPTGNITREPYRRIGLHGSSCAERIRRKPVHSPITTNTGGVIDSIILYARATSIAAARAFANRANHHEIVFGFLRTLDDSRTGRPALVINSALTLCAFKISCDRRSACKTASS